MPQTECRVFQKSSIEKTMQDLENTTKIRQGKEKKLRFVIAIQEFENPSKIHHYNKKGED